MTFHYAYLPSGVWLDVEAIEEWCNREGDEDDITNQHDVFVTLTKLLHFEELERRYDVEVTLHADQLEEPAGEKAAHFKRSWKFIIQL